MIHRNYEKWHDTKDELPPLGEVIEGITPKEWLYSNMERDYFVMATINSEVIWLTPTLNEMKWGELHITHWRFIPPNPKGKRLYVKIKKYKKFWEPKIFWEKD